MEDFSFISMALARYQIADKWLIHAHMILLDVTKDQPDVKCEFIRYDRTKGTLPCIHVHIGSRGYISLVCPPDTRKFCYETLLFPHKSNFWKKVQDDIWRTPDITNSDNYKVMIKLKRYFINIIPKLLTPPYAKYPTIQKSSYLEDLEKLCDGGEDLPVTEGSLTLDLCTIDAFCFGGYTISIKSHGAKLPSKWVEICHPIHNPINRWNSEICIVIKGPYDRSTFTFTVERRKEIKNALDKLLINLPKRFYDDIKYENEVFPYKKLKEYKKLIKLINQQN
jgi:hypothetical protein